MARGNSGRRKQSVADKQAVQKPKEGNPKSMVIRIGAGEVGSSVTQLVQDVRQLMQPDTAVRLKVRSTCNPRPALEQSLTDDRNEERTNCATIPPWPVPLASPTSSSSRDPRPETQTCASQRHLAVQPCISALKNTLWRKTS